MSSSASDHITTPGKSPQFQFYPGDFLRDGKQAAMSLQECGAYIRLMCFCWTDGYIPDELERVARMVGTTDAAMRKLWPAVRQCFTEAGNGRLIHGRLEKERDKQTSHRKRQSDASKKRWDKPRVSDGNATALPTDMPKPSFAVSCLQLSKQKSSGSDAEDPKIADIASSLQEIYPEVYAAARSGAVYRTTQATYERDRPKYYAAAELHPDIKRLRALLEVFLTRPMGDKSSPGTPGQFVNMLPECDEVLRKSGWRATA